MNDETSPSEQRRTALVTGASAGIGAALAREFAARGWDLVLVARREEPMAALAADMKGRFDTTTRVYGCDLADPGATTHLRERLDADGIVVSGLANNAGYGAGGRFDERPWDEHARFLQLMLQLPVELTHALLPDMRDQRFGRIINVSSVAGFLPGASENNLYNATKAFLVRFSQNVHTEMREFGVHVTALCPGFTRTEFHDVAEDLTRVADRVPSIAWQDSASVARAGLDACESNRPVCIPGALNKGLSGLIKVMPERLTQRMLDSRT